MQNQLIDSVQSFVTNYYELHPNSNLTFHHLAHTREVVSAAAEISLASGLSSLETEVVVTAAWFHDIGYCHTYQGHEVLSERIATDFLKDKALGDYQVDSILKCIRVTKIPQQPVSLLERVICDADLHHFSRTDYPAHAHALRTEWELNLGLHYTDVKWDTINYELFKAHNYFTTYGQGILQKRKEANTQLLLRKISGSL